MIKMGSKKNKNIQNVPIHVYPTSKDGIWNYPKLSEFITELEEILKVYGDGYVAISNEMTDEIRLVAVDKIGEMDNRFETGTILFTIA